MALVLTETNRWLQHLVFTGQRPSPFGPIDGLWFGAASRNGDASGGSLTINANLSFDRKEDWVYQLKGLSLQVNAVAAMNMSVQVNTGPLIPTSSAVQNPSYGIVGVADSPGGGTLITTFPRSTGGQMPWVDALLFGDKVITGDYTMIEATFGINTNGAAHSLFCWGFLFTYRSFFRQVPPSVG